MDAIYLAGITPDGSTIEPLCRLALTDLTPAEGANWETLPNCVHPAYEAPCVIVNGLLYVIGGNNGQSSAVATVSCFDLQTLAPVNVPPLPVALRASAATLLNNEIHVTGGLCNGTLQQQVGYYFIFSIGEQTWRRGPDMPDLNRTHASFAFEGNLYVFGGVRPPCYLATGAASWTPLPDWPGRLNYHSSPAVAQVGGYAMVYVVDHDGTPASFAFDTTAGSWAPAPDSHLRAASAGAGVATIQSDDGVAVYLMGGAPGYATGGPPEVGASSWPVVGAELFGYDPLGTVGQSDPADFAEVGSAAPPSSSNIDNPSNATPSPPLFDAVFGDDNRIEVSAITDATRKALAQAVCGIFDAPRISVGSSTYEVVPVSTLQAQIRATYGAPPGNSVLFGTQPVAACGSGALIDSHHILTSAHTFFESDGRIKRDPTQTWIAFGWTSDSGNELFAANVFKGKRVVAWGLSSDPSRGATDWAVIELGEAEDASVTASSAIQPLALADVDAPQSTQLWMVGHPSGLPQKYTTGRVTDASELSCATNLDAFSGSSGSAVLNADNKLVGVLMSGPADFVVVNGKAEEATFTTINPVNVSKTKAINALYRASYTVRFSVGSAFFAGSSDAIGAALDGDPDHHIECSGISWLKSSSYEVPVQFGNSPGFPAEFTFRKFSGVIWSDDLQLSSFTLVRGGQPQTTYGAGWLSNDNPTRGFEINPRYTL